MKRFSKGTIGGAIGFGGLVGYGIHKRNQETRDYHQNIYPYLIADENNQADPVIMKSLRDDHNKYLNRHGRSSGVNGLRGRSSGGMM